MENNNYSFIKEQIDRNKSYIMKFFIADDDVEKEVETALQIIFEKFNKPELAGVLLTCLMELIVNAAKANLKRVIFELNNLNIDDENQYLSGMLKFKNLLVESSYIKYFSNLKNHDYWIKVVFEYDDKGVKIEVINNAHITQIEERRLREKLKKAMQYKDIAQFYLEQGDELEGAGMGIALVIMLMKGLGIDPGLFRIGNIEDKQTLIRLEIPFTDSFVSIRQNIQ